MFGSEVLEVAIGLVFVFLIASLVATSAREAIEGILKTRAIQLERGIRQMLDDPKGQGFTKDIFGHPLLCGLFDGDYKPDQQLTRMWRTRLPRWNKGAAVPVTRERLPFSSNLPAYVPSRNFALALLHTVSKDGPLSLASVKTNVLALPDGQVKKAMLVALAEADGDLERARLSLEAWFDGTMDRVSGWYKRETQWILFGIGLFLAVALNIDGIRIAYDLSSNNKLRQTLVTEAYKSFPALKEGLTEEEVKKQVEGLSDVIGWDRFERRVDEKMQAKRASLLLRAGQFGKTTDDEKIAYAQENMPSRDRLRRSMTFTAIPGWLLTALAVSLGAPFWFDLLNKFMVIRSTVKPYEKSPNEGSEDRGGSPSAADRLASRADRTNPAGGAAETASEAGAVESPAVNYRLAIDRTGLDPGSLALTHDGTPVAVPDDGFVELPLAAGVIHTLEASATANGKPVRWRRAIDAAIDDDDEPLEAELAP